MIKNWKITCAFLFATIIVGIISGIIKLNEQRPGIIIGGIIGCTFIVYGGPLIITYFIKIGCKLFKGNLVGNRFLVTFSTIWGITVVFFLIGTSIIKGNSLEQKDNQSYFLYKPEKSAYSVVFCSKPKIWATATPFGSNSLNGETAEVNSSNFGIFERVEFYLLDNKILEMVNKDFMYNWFNTYCQYNGLSYPEMKYLENNIEKFGEVRAFKESTDQNGNKVKGTFMVRLFIKGNTFFATYVASKSTDFPTREIERFWSSIK